MDSSQDLTDIQRFYKNSTVFLTGATGFIGKLLLEKILRALPVKKVFILVREKKNVSATKRYQDIFESPAFDLLKRTYPSAIKKVFLLEGNCLSPMLGMSPEDQNVFKEEVNVVFHAAATVTFDAPIKKETLTNIRATKDLITLAQQAKKIKAFIYVGTGFSNCTRSEIKEEIYPSKISAEKLITVCESLDDKYLDSMTETLIDNWPNTYTFTKQVTEDYIKRKAGDIPICIIRPTIVISTYSEPVAAFIDNVYSFVGFVLINSLGLCRIYYCYNINLDIVPADFVVNNCIAAGWQTGEFFKPNKTEVPVYNLSSIADNPIKVDELNAFCNQYGREVPTKSIQLYPLYFRTVCKYNYLFFRFFFHTLIAYMLDLTLKINGKEPMYSKGVKKLHRFHETYEYFCTHESYCHMENSYKLLRKMSFRDRTLFNFDIGALNWDSYFSQFMKGCRVYLLKDPLSTLPEGKKHFKLLKIKLIIGLVLAAIILYGIGKFFLFKIAPVLFGILLYPLRRLIC